MTYRFAMPCALLVLAACTLDPENVVENEELVELEPPGGEPQVGPPVYEVTVRAEVDPPYDRREEGSPITNGVGLFHCGAAISASEGALQMPEGTNPDDVGAALLVDYGDLGTQELRLGGAGPYTLSLVYDDSGQPVSSESYTWNDAAFPMGVFPRALDASQTLFQLDPITGTLMIFDPSADYDPQVQTLSTSYTFVTESGQEHAITETYAFGGQHLPIAFFEPWACD